MLDVDYDDIIIDAGPENLEYEDSVKMMSLLKNLQITYVYLTDPLLYFFGVEC